MENKEKTCRICKRVLVGDEKLGLCADCFNKYGTPVAAIGTAGFIGGARYILKNPQQARQLLAMSGKFVLKHSDQVGKLVVRGIRLLK